MGKRGLRITFAVVFLAILGVCIWSALPPREPSYKGRSLSDWLQDYYISFGVQKVESPAVDEAVRHIGTNAIPTLLRMLLARDSRLKAASIWLLNQQNFVRMRITPAWEKNREANLAFEALGADAKNAVPDLVQIYGEKISEASRVSTVESIGAIGPSAKSAIPSLLTGLKTTNDLVRRMTVWALGNIHSEPELVVPELVKRLHDPSQVIRLFAAKALADYGTNATSAVPTLIEMLNDPASRDPAIRESLTNALKQIDPEAAAKAGVK